MSFIFPRGADIYSSLIILEEIITSSSDLIEGRGYNYQMQIVPFRYVEGMHILVHNWTNTVESFKGYVRVPQLSTYFQKGLGTYISLQTFRNFPQSVQTKNRAYCNVQQI